MPIVTFFNNLLKDINLFLFVHDERTEPIIPKSKIFIGVFVYGIIVSVPQYYFDYRKFLLLALTNDKCRQNLTKTDAAVETINCQLQSVS